MKPNLLFYTIILFFVVGCNTLYQSKTINIEVVEPAEIILDTSIQRIAIKFNNCTGSYNSDYAKYYKGKKFFTDTINTDSIAAEVYYQVFLDDIIKQNYFDSIIELPRTNYFGVKITDSLIAKYNLETDSAIIVELPQMQFSISMFNELIQNYSEFVTGKESTKALDPDLGLYTQNEINQIADSTNADLFFSFDYFTSVDGVSFIGNDYGIETVVTAAYWNIYDLKTRKLKYYNFESDTVSWDMIAFNLKEAAKKLPPRKDAILNAADMAATKFSNYLLPHWIEVQRMYYRTGHLDIKEANNLVLENKWMEAAKIWKAHIDNPNKNIRAKCMFNLALACEMEGNIDAAMDWVVRSYYIFKNKNEEHSYNCLSYIKILSQRKLDYKKLDRQFR